MTTFQDGPAKGQHLMLKRHAKFLRVVVADGKWDALDQPEDTPQPNETLYAYVVVGEIGMCHINRGGGRGGFYAIANYRFVPIQPDQETMRDSSRWQAWCHANAAFK